MYSRNLTSKLFTSWTNCRKGLDRVSHSLDSKESGSTYKSPLKLVLMDADLNAGHASEPWSETQLAWAIDAGRDAARRAMARALVLTERVCFWR